jgi:two-component system, OmpR family, response regulator
MALAAAAWPSYARGARRRAVHATAACCPMPTDVCRSARIGIASGDAALVALVVRTLASAETEVVPLDLDAGTHDAAGVLLPPDVVLLDRRTLAGFARQMRLARRRWPTIPLMVLGARDELECARLLDEGADDACVACSAILASRLHAVARRARSLNADRRIAVGDVVLDREHRRVWCAGDEVALSRREYDVLTCLVHYTPKVVGRRTLSEFVWGETTPQPNTVEVYVGYLRRKLARSREVAIATVRRGGYLLGRARR